MVRAEQPVPPRQIEPEVAVVLGALDRVVHAVHIRSDHHVSNNAVEPGRHTDIGMIELRGGVQHHLEHNHRNRRNAERDHGRDLDCQGDQDFEWMEA
jgi:hypothetical protein